MSAITIERPDRRYFAAMDKYLILEALFRLTI